MGCLRVLICILFPPLAVLDKGCGSFIIVLLLTMVGWIPGVLAALIICGQQPAAPQQKSRESSLAAIAFLIFIAIGASGYFIKHILNDNASPQTTTAPVSTPIKPLPAATPALVSKPSPTTSPLQSQGAQQRAIQQYPQLGIANSPMNLEFVRRYKEYQHTNPDYFKNPEWPLNLAKECFDYLQAPVK